MEQIRAFIAVAASEDIRSLVARVQDDLRGVGADVKWVKPDNVHITLKFLGNVPSDRVADLADAIRGAVRGLSEFDVAVVGTGTFPGGRRAPRVVWLGLGDGADRLREVAENIDANCAALGFKREDRPFRSHLTIGRVRRGSGKLAELAERAAQVEYKPLQLKVDRVNLVKSRLSPQGPTYTVLESVALERS